MVEKIFKENIERHEQAYEVLSAKDKKLSVMRLLVFLAAAALIIYFSSISWILALILTVVGLIGFSRLLKYHNGIINEKLITGITVELNKKELQALDNDLSGFNKGDRYLDANHPYIIDLDIFGEHSIFQLLSRCNTSYGENLLAHHLSNPTDANTIHQYQDAVKELEPKVDWRQKLYAIGHKDVKAQNEVSTLMRWVSDQQEIGINKLAMYGCLIFSWAIFLGLMTIMPWGTALIAFLPNTIFFYKYSKKVNLVHLLLDKHEKTLKPYAELIAFTEKSNFNSPILKQLVSDFNKDDTSASQQLSKFAYYLKQLDMRTNFFGILFNVLFLWEDIYILKIEAWKKQHRELLLIWLDNLGRIEYFSSMANFAHMNPEFCYPTINTKHQYNAADLGHPLIDRKSRIGNDLNMGTQTQIKIITGSNMGGKSTFLRSVGINMVLAYMGSKVCATSQSSPILNVMTSMRTQDAINESTSSFYAELKRLKSVIDQVEARDDIFFLLDEILKGTNSNDRHNGAKAMIKQLLKNNGSGMISTHDLELGLMVEELPTQIENVCFEVEVQGEELVFDYKLKKGISKSFNATHLMRNIGIEI